MMPHPPPIAPNPPRLSGPGEAVARIGAPDIPSSDRPEVRAFEAEITGRLYDVGLTIVDQILGGETRAAA